MNEPLRIVSPPVTSEIATSTRDFEDLVYAESAHFFGALCLLAGDRFEAEDVMQEAFLKVWERWDRVAVMEDPTGYLYRTALNLYRKRMRRATLAARRAIHLAPRGEGLTDVETRDAVVRQAPSSPRRKKGGLPRPRVEPPTNLGSVQLPSIVLASMTETVSTARVGDVPLRVAALGFDDFFRSTHDRAFGAMCLVTGDRYEAEEIVQEAYLRLFERWDRVASLDDPEGYLFRTTMNVFRNRYRRAMLSVRRAVAIAPTPRDDLVAVEERDELIRLMRSLAPRERAAVLATSILDLPAEEAGRLLGMQAATVRALASRARKHLRDRAEEAR